MSLFGFDALGRLALAQIQRGNLSMPAVSGSFTMSGQAATFGLSEATAAGAFTFTAPSISQVFGVASGSFTVTGAAQTFTTAENVQAGSYALTGQIANNITGAAEAGSFVVAGANTPLIWTGAGVDTSYTGGVGHFLEELERQKQLNAITRKVPAPVDRRTAPRFAPFPAVQPMPSAPMVDMAAMEAQRQTDTARVAAVRRRRREEEAVLLLAS
jgi:hypothetical protein